jgi:murein DD-endopeptidase MepM/ murein hydrolase activator NlpD
VRAEARGLPTIYLAEIEKAEPSLPQIYLCESEGHGLSGRLKWLAGTCVAGTVSLCLICFAVYASMNMEDGSGMLSSIKRASLAALRPIRNVTIARDRQSPTDLKGDLIETTSAGFASRQVIHETVVQHQGQREFITIKPFVRIVVGLSTQIPPDASQIPPFDPFKLYSDDTPIGKGDADSGATRVTTNVVALPLAPQDLDGIELNNEEVARLVDEAAENYALAEQQPYSMDSDGGGATLQQASYHPDGGVGNPSLPHNFSVINKTVEDSDDSADDDPTMLAGSQTKTVDVKRHDSLASILKHAGADPSQTRAILDALKPIFSPGALKPGQQVRLTLIPAPSDTGQMEPARVSIFAPHDTHLATVALTNTGDYVASNQSVEAATQAAMDDDGSDRATLYKSFYHAALEQHLPPKTILKLLRIHSYDVDFKQKARSGDSFEAFFDVPDGDDAADATGELLYTSMTVDNVTHAFYRFRTPDGVVDYYDRFGNSAKKFLMRDPVRGGRFTSGFGMRLHPLLGVWRMHNGVDWAAPSGTPIVAAGDGIVESAGRDGAYGNYIRIRHANGFQTGYGHLSRFASGLEPGVHVKQGQVIGYVGSTGLSTGPHCHFEVLVNNKFVDPMTIHVPRGLQLRGHELAEFERERSRIDSLMQMDPVTTKVADVSR